MNDLASSEPTCEHDDDVSMGVFFTILASSELTCVRDDDVSTRVLWMSLPPLNRHVNMMMTSMREFYEIPRLLWTDLWAWWWRQYGSLINILASSELICVRDDDISAGVLWMTSSPL